MTKPKRSLPDENIPSWLQAALFKQPFTFRADAAPQKVADALRSGISSSNGWSRSTNTTLTIDDITATKSPVFTAYVQRYIGLIRVQSVYVVGQIQARSTGETVVQGYTRFSLWVLGEVLFAGLLFALLTTWLVGGWVFFTPLGGTTMLVLGMVALAAYWRASNDR
ncbi:MAG: hypothetical protein AAF125_24490, partial [Chloroflexota bacterium]